MRRNVPRIAAVFTWLGGFLALSGLLLVTGGCRAPKDAAQGNTAMSEKQKSLLKQHKKQQDD